MTQDQTEAAFKSLAEEPSGLSHSQPLTPSEQQREVDDCWDLAYLFRLIPSLCPRNIFALHRMMMACSPSKTRRASSYIQLQLIKGEWHEREYPTRY